ncbi:hypothetical protein [Paraherbaspirillum soli]|uniref:DUF4388 domain-containing protein n=1 Tax=Paraherbaspirillum soli TaxID=631222 RepID=A0ABW0M776_9BURK
MAIWGRLSDFSLHLVLTRLARRRPGVIHVDICDGNQYYVHVSAKGLTALQMNSTDYGRLDQARTVLARLLSATTGTFRYLPEDTSPLRKNFHLDLQELAAVANNPSAVDGASYAQEKSSVFHHSSIQKLLPHADTRFILSGRNLPLNNEVLQHFVKQSSFELTLGASAAELARLLGEDLEKVRFYLYRLREADVIVPMRAFRNAATSADRHNDAARLRPTLVQRLISLFE